MREAFLLSQLDAARERSQGCTLCGLEQAQVESYLTGVANDGVNDIPLRQKLARRGGYCARHTEQFVKLASPLSGAILLDAFLHDRLGRVAAGRRARKIDCEACAVREKTGARFVKSIGQHARSEVVQAHVRTAQLCLPHLEELAPRLSLELRQTLVAGHDALRFDLQEVIRKHDYRYNEALTEDEKASLGRAVALMRGSG